MDSKTRGRQPDKTPIKIEAQQNVEDAIQKFKGEHRCRSDKAVAEGLNISHSGLTRFRKPDLGIGQVDAEEVCVRLGIEPSEVLDYSYRNRVYTSKGRSAKSTSGDQDTCLEAAFLFRGCIEPKNRQHVISLVDHLAPLTIQSSRDKTIESIQSLDSNSSYIVMHGRITSAYYTQVELILQEIESCFVEGTGKIALKPCQR
jgi:hypothetical protein